jgi:predicted alpha/beta-fold hydrolase
VRERIELADGDFLDVDWRETGGSGPVVLIVHGLCGDSRSHYVRGLAKLLGRAGLRTAVLHHRGCGGEPNRLPRSYHAGHCGDIDWVLRLIRAREPRTPLFAAGFSIGGSMLLNWLSRNHDLLTAACTVSTPLDLAQCSKRMETGLSRIYQAYLVSEMKRRVRSKSRRLELPVDVSRLGPVRTFREFDDLVTAPLHGFEGADQYYTLCSARQCLRRIRTRTLIIHAADDPLSTVDALPGPHDLPESGAVQFELSESGGHCGFVGGAWPHRPRWWADHRITEFLTSNLNPDDADRCKIRPPGPSQP